MFTLMHVLMFYQNYLFCVVMFSFIDGYFCCYCFDNSENVFNAAIIETILWLLVIIIIIPILQMESSKVFTVTICWNFDGSYKLIHTFICFQTGKSRGYANIEFEYIDVAKIVADTMNNYLMFQKLLKCKKCSVINLKIMRK